MFVKCYSLISHTMSLCYQFIRSFFPFCICALFPKVIGCFQSRAIGAQNPYSFARASPYAHNATPYFLNNAQAGGF